MAAGKRTLGGKAQIDSVEGCRTVVDTFAGLQVEHCAALDIFASSLQGCGTVEQNQSENITALDKIRPDVQSNSTVAGSGRI